MSYQVICALGDSITNGYWDEEGLGWFGRLSQKIAKAYPYKYGFNNLAQSGDRSTDLLNRLRGEALSRSANIVIIAIGVNDLIRRGSADAPTDMSAGYSQRTWQSILPFAKEHFDKAVVVSVHPVAESRMPFIGSKDWNMWYLNEDIKEYNHSLKIWCGENDIPFLDLSAAWEGLKVEDYIHDVAHPNAKGHQLIADAAFQKLVSEGILV